MNFKKKDPKRSSYYVWFLGAKESKGFRGDDYVTPVLSYLLENAVGDFEPSKVTLQVSHKGFKIIQMLTVPRKSAKLTADQTSQLFANCRRLSTIGGGEHPPSSSSMLKTEQVKHHIAHDSITWVYQEEDIICAILLLYNPITRCPVHVHAYRCDSIETANNLRRQLQALVDKPENQKKFREIEARLAAKGLLMPPASSSSSGGYEDERGYAAAGPSRHAAKFERPTTSSNKCNNSDGRSTRTEGSDEHSEESNSSSNELGFSMHEPHRHRHKSSTSEHHRRHLNQRHQEKCSSPPPPVMRYSGKSGHRPHSPPLSSLPPMHHHHHHQALKSKNSFPSSPPEVFHHRHKMQPSGSKSSGGGHKLKPSPPTSHDTEPDMPVSVTAALYDSLAAELRAKLGNPKMGPLLLPPKDYESSEEGKAKNKDKTASSSPLSRSESSGKSSSGIGSDEALSSENNRQKSCYNSSSSSGGTNSSHGSAEGNRRFDADANVGRGGGGKGGGGVPDSRFLFGGNAPVAAPRGGGGHREENERQLYSLQMYSSDDDDEDDVVRTEMFDYTPDDILDVDVEDFEENVNFTLATPYHLVKSKSIVDLYHRQSKAAGTQPPPPPQQSTRPAKPARTTGAYFEQQQQQHRRPKQHSNLDTQQMSKLYGSNPVLSRGAAPLKEYKSNEPKELVVGRREQRSKHYQQAQPPPANYSRYEPSKMSSGGGQPPDRYNRSGRGGDKTGGKPQQFYFAGSELAPRGGRDGNYLARSNGNLAALEQYGPSSINMLVSADRSVSPFYYLHNQVDGGGQHYPPKSRGPPPPPGPHDARYEQQHHHHQQRRRQLEQPFSRYSYIDVDHASSTYLPR